MKLRYSACSILPQYSNHKSVGSGYIEGRADGHICEQDGTRFPSSWAEIQFPKLPNLTSLHRCYKRLYMCSKFQKGSICFPALIACQNPDETEQRMWSRSTMVAFGCPDESNSLLMHLQFDMTFRGLPCEWISLDAMDVSGENHLDVVSTSSCILPTWLFRRACAAVLIR